jgi:hypothetical protein
MLSWPSPGRHERRMQGVLNLIFQKHPFLLAFLFERDLARLRKEGDLLISEASAFSSGEQILVRLGLDLWDGSGGVRLLDIIERLDIQNYHNVLLGLRHLREIEPDGPEYVWRQPKMAYSELGDD